MQSRLPGLQTTLYWLCGTWSRPQQLINSSHVTGHDRQCDTHRSHGLEAVIFVVCMMYVYDVSKHDVSNTPTCTVATSVPLIVCPSLPLHSTPASMLYVGCCLHDMSDTIAPHATKIKALSSHRQHQTPTPTAESAAWGLHHSNAKCWRCIATMRVVHSLGLLM